MKAFAGGIAAQPSTYMLSPSDGKALMRAVTEYEEAVAAANTQSPGTRTAGMVAQKAVARRAAEQICRHYYSLIKLNKGVSDASKIKIGVRPINPARVRINCPPSPPILNVLAATPGGHTPVYHDSMVPTRRAKPFGATQLQLMVAVADRPVRGRDVRLPGAQGSAGTHGSAGNAGTRKRKRKGSPPPPPPDVAHRLSISAYAFTVQLEG